MRLGVLLLTILFSSFSWALTDKEVEALHTYISPYIQGDTLYIRGKIDGHIYDFLSYNVKQMESVKIIDIVSFGGNAAMGLDIAEKIKALKKITRVSPGMFCASACVPLFAAGAQRQMSQQSWIGIHSARLGASYSIQFESHCKTADAQGQLQFDEAKPGCGDFLAKWYEKAYEATDKMFSFYENNGVSVGLRNEYFAMPLVEPDWEHQYNVMKTPDWVVDANTALKHHLATEILP